MNTRPAPPNAIRCFSQSALPNLPGAAAAGSENRRILWSIKVAGIGPVAQCLPVSCSTGVTAAPHVQADIPVGGLGLTWLGQAGFLFRTAAGRRVFLDPYLSDACELIHGFKRLSLPALEACEVEADWVILTHEHTDHLDPDAIPEIARRNPGCRFAGPSGCSAGLAEAGVTEDRRLRLDPHQRYDLGDLVVHTAPADHGDFSPTALSFLLDFGGVRIMVSGDSSWRPKLFQPLYDLKPHVVLTVINGSFGNMNHIDAARMVAEAAPGMAIPCHFWTLAEQGAGDPAGFVHACAKFCPQVEAKLLRPGEELMLVGTPPSGGGAP